MLTAAEGDQQARLVEWIWPLLVDHPPQVQRIVIARLAALYLNGRPTRSRQNCLSSLVEGIKLRLEDKE